MKIETPEEYKHNEKELLSLAPMRKDSFDFDALRKDAENKGPFRLKIGDEVVDVEYNSVSAFSTPDGKGIISLTFAHRKYKDESFAPGFTKNISTHTYCTTPISEEEPVSVVFKDGTELDLSKYNDEYKYYMFNTDALKVGSLIQFHHESDIKSIRSIGVVTKIDSGMIAINYITNRGITAMLCLCPTNLYSDGYTLEWNEIEYSCSVSAKDRKALIKDINTFYTEELEEYTMYVPSDEDDDESEIDTSEWVDIDDTKEDNDEDSKDEDKESLKK